MPLGLLVAEGLADSVGALADKIGDGVFLNGAGLRCCTQETARCMVAARDAAEAERRARVQQEAAERRAKGNPLRDRVRALQQAQADGALPDRYDPC